MDDPNMENLKFIAETLPTEEAVALFKDYCDFIRKCTELEEQAR